MTGKLSKNFHGVCIGPLSKIYAVNVFIGDFCSLAGFMLICKASSTSSTWHNFVSDADHWKDENGETPCINSGGMYI